MNIELNQDQAEFVQQAITCGKYSSAEELIAKAIKLLQNKEQELDELRQKIAVGERQIASGQVVDGEQFFAQLTDRLK